MIRPGLDPARVRVITFDAAGTLLAPQPSVGEIYAAASRRHGREIAPDVLEARFREAFGNLKGAPRAVVSDPTERAFWKEVVRRCFAPEYPDPEIEKVFAELWEKFAHGESWRVLPAVSKTLEALSAKKNLRLAVLSNWDARLHRVLRDLGLNGYFSHVFVSSEIGAEKPDVRAFRTVEAAEKVKPENCLHVGDSYTHDYAAAHAAGWQAALVGARDDSPEALHLARIDELVSLLK